VVEPEVVQVSDGLFAADINGSPSFVAQFVNGEFQPLQRDRLNGEGVKVMTAGKPGFVCVAPGWCNGRGCVFTYDAAEDVWLEGRTNDEMVFCRWRRVTADVSFHLAVNNVSSLEFVAAKGMEATVKEAVKVAITEVGTGITEENLHLQLLQGRTLVLHVTISSTHACPDIPEWCSLSTTALTNGVARCLAGLPGIKDVSRGLVSVTKIEGPSVVYTWRTRGTPEEEAEALPAEQQWIGSEEEARARGSCSRSCQIA
jgi:hypothetical protein